MKTPALILGVALLVIGCDSGSHHKAEIEAIQSQLLSQRAQVAQLRAELDAQRQRLSRSLATIESRVEELDRTLGQASAEIWGDGSSTGSHLSTAKRTLESLKAEVDVLSRNLRAGPFKNGRGHDLN